MGPVDVWLVGGQAIESGNIGVSCANEMSEELMCDSGKFAFPNDFTDLAPTQSCHSHNLLFRVVTWHRLSFVILTTFCFAW